MVCGRSFDVDSTQNIISFCTGYGGIELGLRRAGVDVRVVCNVEIEAFVQANLVAKTEEALMDDAPIFSDLKAFPAEIFRGKIHGITCGYPCQPFSSAGKRKGEKDPRHLWPYIRRHIRAIGPSWVFAENVRGHTTMGLWRVLSDLEADGYRTEWGLYSAEETGAPHQRIRCFILAKLPHTRSPYSREVQLAEGRSEEDAKKQKLNSNGDKRGIEQLAHAEGDDVEGRDLRQREVQSRGSGTQPEELAHTASREPRQSQARNGGQDTSGGSEDTRWPARPGEEQYEWEEPRVTEAQSELGGAVDGLTHRVDRLRLLGNGVVPQTAELAWKSLWRKINEQL